LALSSLRFGFSCAGHYCPRSQQAGFIPLLLELVVLYIIIKLATTKIPLLG
jgi:uncharacterized membrane protein SirB2